MRKHNGKYCASGMILRYNNYFLLVLENKRKQWSFPKGKKDLNDISSLETALRELEEETNIVIQNIDKNIKGYTTVKQCIFYEYIYDDVPPVINFSKNVEILDIKWVHINNINDYNLNFLTELYFKYNIKNIL